MPRGKASNASAGYRYKKKWRGQQREQVLEAFGRRCYFCGHPGEDGNGRGLVQAHVVAHREGGADDYSNMVLVCRRCSGRLDGSRRYR